MNNRHQVALVTLAGALIVGAVAQLVIQHEAAVLGISMLEIGLAGYVIGAALTRAVSH